MKRWEMGIRALAAMRNGAGKELMQPTKHNFPAAFGAARAAAVPTWKEFATQARDSTAEAGEPNAPAMHPGLKRSMAADTYFLAQPMYSKEELDIKLAHRPPKGLRDKTAFTLVQTMRKLFDQFTGYKPQQHMTEAHWIRRCLFLETVAGVPGMVAGMLRHMESLRRMKRDNGWIHTLLEEAENERMHLLTFMEIRQGGPLFRLAVLGAQGVFFNLFFLSYILSPKICHRFVGYLEEEAVRTYTHLLHDIDSGVLPDFVNRKVPDVALKYWQLPKTATMRDVVEVIRADEACHSHVNHTFASMKKTDKNPFNKHPVVPKDDFTRPPEGVSLQD